MSGKKFVEIGKILKPFGVKGDLKVMFYIDDTADLKDVKMFYIKDKASGFKELPFDSLKFSENPEYAKVRFTQITDRTLAEAWRLVPLYVEEELLAEPVDGEYFIKDLMDLDAEYEGKTIGKVFNVFEVAGRELFVIRQTDSKNDLAVPFDDYYVDEVLIAEGKITFNHLDELL